MPDLASSALRDAWSYQSYRYLFYASPTEHPLFLFSMKVRNNRPGREKTMDDVEGVLIRQQGLVGAFQEKVGVRRM